MEKSQRQNTRLEAEGAEFLVLGNLLIEGITTHKTYTNIPGYDLIASSPEMNRSARIQVKSRRKTKAEGFIINNFDCDFVVIVKLNRGSKDGKQEIQAPQFYVLPVDIVKGLPRTEGWGKISFRSIENLQHYFQRWDLIRDFLEGKG
ncbi:MAG: hypothetical protein GJT30_03590 [Geobacter sp.]|nr:hypothetical protein [Geobacter sp.]